MITIKTQQGDRAVTPHYTGSRFCVHPIHTPTGIDGNWLAVTHIETGLCLWQHFPYAKLMTVKQLCDWLDEHFPLTIDNPVALREQVDAQARALGLEL